MVEHLTVLIVGNRAKEHTISSAYERSPQVKRIVIAPGNDFNAYGRQKEVIIDKNCSLKDPMSILELARKYKPDLVDVAQDDALGAGTVDLLQVNGFLTFGPNQASARIESDKRWSREFMQRHQIPHPKFRYFGSEEDGIDYVRELYSRDPHQVVYVKASGLAAGKGALRSENLEQAITNITKMEEFPDGAGKIFLVEEGLVGEEFSYYAISDGKTYRIFKSAQDNKTVFNFDQGDQTGGMGANSPAMVTQPISSEIEEHLIRRAINGMSTERIPYVGILYLGGIVVDGKPMNIEYNARWGDPECQVVLPGVQNDYVDLVFASLGRTLSEVTLVEDSKTRVCVVGASRGYPNDYSAVRGKRIYGLEEAMKMEGVQIFGAGIAVQDGRFYANGGRLFSVVAEGGDIIEARQRAYDAIAHIYVEGNNLHYRTDIGWRDVERFLKTLV